MRHLPSLVFSTIASPGLRHNLAAYSTVSNPLPATFLRGGTSKGIFLNRKLLPADKSEWTPIFLGIMGSPDPEYGRQLNGMGGGVSSLSKICVVGEPSDSQRAEGIDADYTFCQVGIKDSSIDYSGNCGNLSSMIGVFAVDEGICSPRTSASSPGLGTVRSYNTNTNKRIDTTFPVSSGAESTAVLDHEQVAIAGVPRKASRIDLEFVSPAGARTGKLLPTGNPVDTVSISHKARTSVMRMSLVDATNPTVFITSEDLASAIGVTATSDIIYGDAHTDDVLEQTRQHGAKLMGLDPSAQAQPKIAILSAPSPSDPHTDIFVHALSMQILHKAVPMTVGLCLGVAANVKGTLAWDIAQHSRRSGGGQDGEGLVTIKHPSGDVDVGAVFSPEGDVKSAKVIRTGRRLMKGVVWW